MRIDRIDHLVLTVRDPEATVTWYRRTLGLEPVRFGAGRLALQVGDSKLNVHRAGAELAPHAARPTPGSADLCFTTNEPLETVVAELSGLGVAIELGPVTRAGARSTLRSVYVRDPDGNLVEIANEVSGSEP